MRTFLSWLLAATLGCAVVTMASVTMASVAMASDGHDQDRARRAVQQGTMLPLRDIIARAEAEVGGEVVEAELEDERGGPVYEIKLLTRAGRLVKVRYDARTGAALPGGEGKKR